MNLQPLRWWIGTYLSASWTRRGTREGTHAKATQLRSREGACRWPKWDGTIPLTGGAPARDAARCFRGPAIWASAAAGPRLRRALWPTLQAAPVELHHLEFVGIDAVEAAHVDHHHVIAAAPLAIGVGLYPAGCAEEMMDDAFVELEIGGRIGAR